MKIKIWMIALVVLAMGAGPAMGQVRKRYDMTAEQVIDVTGIPPAIDAPGTWEGPFTHAQVRDNGDGTITVEDFTIHNHVKRIYDASGTTGIPGSTAAVQSDIKFRPGLPFSGTLSGGTPSNSIFGGTASFGDVSGWTATGQIYCKEAPTGSNGCSTTSGLTDGTWGPGPPIDPTHNTDGWTFASDAASFNVGASIHTFVTLGGFVNGYINNIVATENPSGVPVLLPMGVAALGASISFVGARALRRRKSA
jgi:hypothetical protein